MNSHGSCASVWWTDCGAQSDGYNNAGTSWGSNSWRPTQPDSATGIANLPDAWCISAYPDWTGPGVCSACSFDCKIALNCRLAYGDWTGSVYCPGYKTFSCGLWWMGCQNGPYYSCNNITSLGSTGGHTFIFCVKMCDMYHCYYEMCNYTNTTGTIYFYYCAYSDGWNSGTGTCGPYTGQLYRGMCAYTSTFRGYCSPSPTNPVIMCQKVTTNGGAVTQQRQYYCMAMLSSGCCYYIANNCFTCNGIIQDCIYMFCSNQYAACYITTDCTSNGCCYMMPKGVRYGGYWTCYISTSSLYMRYNTVCFIAARYNVCYCSWHEGNPVFEYTWETNCYCTVNGVAGTQVSGIITQTVPYCGSPTYLRISARTCQLQTCMWVWYTYDVRPWTSSLYI